MTQPQPGEPGTGHPLHARSLGILETRTGDIEVEHFFQAEGAGGTCHCGRPSHDPGLLGLDVTDADGGEAYLSLDAPEALILANRLTRGANLILESHETPPDIEREAARYGGTPADAQ